MLGDHAGPQAEDQHVAGAGLARAAPAPCAGARPRACARPRRPRPNRACRAAAPRAPRRRGRATRRAPARGSRSRRRRARPGGDRACRCSAAPRATMSSRVGISCSRRASRRTAPSAPCDAVAGHDVGAGDVRKAAEVRRRCRTSTCRSRRSCGSPPSTVAVSPAATGNGVGSQSSQDVDAAVRRCALTSNGEPALAPAVKVERAEGEPVGGEARRGPSPRSGADEAGRAGGDACRDRPAASGRSCSGVAELGRAGPLVGRADLLVEPVGDRAELGREGEALRA